MTSQRQKIAAVRKLHESRHFPPPYALWLARRDVANADPARSIEEIVEALSTARERRARRPS